MNSLKTRKYPSQNVVNKLRNREIHWGRPPGSFPVRQRQFYTCIFPNMTVVNVEKPPCFLRKFTPDGQLLVAFSPQQTGIEIYEYRGVTACGQLLHQLSGVVLYNESEYSSLEIRKNLFQTLFSLKHLVGVIQTGAPEQLNRECSLFTADNRHLIVASSSTIQDRYPTVTEVYQNNESLSPSSTFTLEDIWIYCLDIQEGRLCDKTQFKCDKIFLAHNQGLYLCERLLAVLSVQHQTVHLIQIEESTGRFIPLVTVGRFLYDDDELLIERALLSASTHSDVDPLSENVLCGFKHRILTFLYKKAAKESAESGNPFYLRSFYQRYEVYRKLKILRMQLLDKDTILLRVASEDVASLRVELNAQNSIFVVYNMRTTEIVDIFESTSERLLEIYESCADYFRHPDRTVRFPCSMSSSQPAREHHQRYKQTILHAKGGGKVEVTRRVLAQLPVGAQSFSGSPYLDLNLFSYDDKLISLLERPRTAGDTAVKFYDRNSEKLKFQLFCGLVNRGMLTPQIPTQRPLVAFIFHPSDPFAISVQRNNRDYVVNFHLRACSMGPEGSDWTPEPSKITAF